MVLSLHSAPNPIQSIRFSRILPPFPLHFHSISISIWISTPLKGSSGKEPIVYASWVWYLHLHVRTCAQFFHVLEIVRRNDLTLARTARWCNPPPLRFFTDSEKTAALRAAGFWATLWGKPCTIFGKKFDRVRSGHGAMTS